MKIFLEAELAFRRLRKRIVRRLNNRQSFRRATLKRLDPDIIWMTRAFPDHILTFSPHEVIGKFIYREGGFQRDLTERVLALLRERGAVRGRVAIEVGANIGTQSVYLLLSGLFEHLVCVEPDERNLRLLKRNLSDNGLEDRTTIVASAVGDHDGEVGFHVDDINHGRGGLLRTDGTARTVRVPLNRLDTILSNLGIDPSDVGFVWMDIEGLEYEAFTTMHLLLSRRVPILFEYSPAIYGAEKTERMKSLLARHYDQCILMGADETALKVEDLPHRAGDVLLLP